MMSNSELLYQLRCKKKSLQRRHFKVQETDLMLADKLTYRIELINLLIAEFGSFRHPKSLENLLRRAKF